MDGLTTFQKLQANSATQTIPVILLTAKVQASDRRRYEDLGITATIPKPFDPLQLANQMAEILGWNLWLTRISVIESFFPTMDEWHWNKPCGQYPYSALRIGRAGFGYQDPAMNSL